jgi:acyl-CoA hydrolase
MDLAGSAVAVRRANGRVVTVAVTAMSFQRSVVVGDEVSCYAKILKVGRTSITVKVEAFARRERGGTRGSLRQDDLLGESAFGTLPTSTPTPSMSAIGGKADISDLLSNVR